MALLIAAFGTARAAIYKEVGGVVVVEAEHFDSRTKAEDNDHEYKIAPDELSSDEAGAAPGQYLNARGGKYMVVLPDSGENRNNTDSQAIGPRLDFKVEITTTGEYQLYIRDAAYDGGSDSFYARIVELQTDQGGPGPDWYRLAFDPTPAKTDFDDTLNNPDDPDSTAGWIGYSTRESNGGGAAGDREKTLWTISKPGTYTIRIQQREDGNGVDAVCLQRSNLPVPATNIPESLVTGALDTDNDGLPDVWETKYGLNPNDASDAAKDCNNNGVANLDEFKAGLDPCDTTKPTVLSATTTGTFDTVRLIFSEDLDATTAASAANYAISPSLAVTAAAYKSKVVTLTTAQQTPGATAYTVTVKGVKDLSKNEVAADTKATFYSYLLSKAGVLKFSYWGDITGTPVDGLTSDARYPASPDMVGAVSSFNSRDIFPNDSHENYGATIDGFLTPTEAGSYDFFLRSDDASQFFISTDDTEGNLTMVAEETGCCDAYHETGNGDPETTQAPIALVAGKKYFVRVIYKEGGGGDYAQVAWRKTTDTTPAGSLQPIPGKFLTSAVDLPVPAEGRFLTQTPAPNARNVSPASGVTIAHSDGKTEWTAANVSLKFDGTAVTPTFNKEGIVATITYRPSALLPSKSTHTISLGYADPGGQPATQEWSFEVTEYKGPVKDAVKGYDALLLPAANQTANKGGFSGADGDYAIDLTNAGGPIQVVDANFLTALNTAAAADEMSVSMWIKKYDIANSSAFWFSSPSQARVFQAHTPWSDNVVYFDTAGCCDGSTQRISAGIDTFPGFSGDTTDTSWWQNWRLYVFTKKADAKQIYIDGTLFLEGSSSGKLSTDINQLVIAAETISANKMHGLVDDFAVYSKALTAANVTALKGGTKPSALPATVGLVAYWDFNTVAVEGAKFTKISLAAGNVTIEWTGGGTLQRADAVTGPWTDVAGATSPSTVPPTGTGAFYRIKQ